GGPGGPGRGGGVVPGRRGGRSGQEGAGGPRRDAGGGEAGWGGGPADLPRGRLASADAGSSGRKDPKSVGEVRSPPAPRGRRVHRALRRRNEPGKALPLARRLRGARLSNPGQPRREAPRSPAADRRPHRRGPASPRPAL